MKRCEYCGRPTDRPHPSDPEACGEPKGIDCNRARVAMQSRMIDFLVNKVVGRNVFGGWFSKAVGHETFLTRAEAMHKTRSAAFKAAIRRRR